MKQILIPLLASGLAAAHAHAAAPEALSTPEQKLSYSVGADLGRNFHRYGIGLDTKLLTRGIRDGLAGKELAVSDRELRQVMTGFQAEVRRKIVQEHRVAAQENKKAGSEFLTRNGAKAGVTTLPDGVQYEVLKSGSGPRPTAADFIVCNYRGTLLDGTEFDASEPGKPAQLKVAQLIPGWREAVTQMPAGSKWRIFVPPQLAYGERGASGDIGPNATLTYEMELVAVK